MQEELLRKKSLCNQCEWYDPVVKEEMVRVSLAHLEILHNIVQRHLRESSQLSEEEKIRSFSTPRVAALISRLLQRGEQGDMRSCQHLS